ncbi:MAG TPA: hypothetical protein VKX45_03945 [Bryobacteraceae bacterium]|jgi:hypothetical protein|nr:hypothetical protein [Bryobacteraceae bacterium]
MDQETIPRFARIEAHHCCPGRRAPQGSRGVQGTLAESQRRHDETQRHIDELAIETRLAMDRLTKQVQQHQEQTEFRFRETDERVPEFAAAGKATKSESLTW